MMPCLHDFLVAVHAAEECCHIAVLLVTQLNAGGTADDAERGSMQLMSPDTMLDWPACGMTKLLHVLQKGVTLRPLANISLVDMLAQLKGGNDADDVEGEQDEDVLSDLRVHAELSLPREFLHATLQAGEEALLIIHMSNHCICCNAQPQSCWTPRICMLHCSAFLVL